MKKKRTGSEFDKKIVSKPLVRQRKPSRSRARKSRKVKLYLEAKLAEIREQSNDLANAKQMWWSD